jgi:hypothetical protein
VVTTQRASATAALRYLLFKPIPAIVNGQPCIRGMRFTVRRVLEAAALIKSAWEAGMCALLTELIRYLYTPPVVISCSSLYYVLCATYAGASH